MMPPGRSLEPDGGTDSRTPEPSAAGRRAGGATLAAGSALFVVGLVTHPPPSADPAVFMATIAEDPLRWRVAHLVTAIALFALAGASLVMLTTVSRVGGGWSTILAWAAVAVGALWVTTAALAEATVVTRAAVTGDVASFETWQLFSEVHAAAFLALAGGLGVVALQEARLPAPRTPVWAASLGALAGLIAPLAFLLALSIGVTAAGLVWLASTVVLGLWSTWFGVALARSPAGPGVPAREAETSKREAVP